MKKVLYVACILFLPQIIFAQHKLKRYEFAEFGISIPFFENATVSEQNVRNTNFSKEYNYQKTEGKSKISGTMTYYTNWGCVRVDSFYNNMERFARRYDDKSIFRPLTETSHTHYLGWTFYDAHLTIDNHPDNIMRMVQAFYNGNQALVIDVIFVNEDFTSIGNEIFKEPGYQSILRPLDMPELGLQLRIRGHVSAIYNKEEQKYYLGRCDKLGTSYPYVTIEKVQGDPEMLALGELAAQRKEAGFNNARMESLPAEGTLAKFTGGITKIVADATTGTLGRVVSYFFTTGGQSYKAMLIVPYGPDDNRLLYKQDREISVETAKEMDTRVIELLENCVVQ